MRTHPVDKLLEQHCYKSAAGLLQLVRLTCVYLDNQRDTVFLGILNVFFVCSDVILGFQLRAGITKTGYFNVLVEFRDSKDELPFSFSLLQSF